MRVCGPAADPALAVATAMACCGKRPLCPRDPRIMSLVRWIMHTVGRSPGMPKCGRRRQPGAWQVCHASTRDTTSVNLTSITSSVNGYGYVCSARGSTGRWVEPHLDTEVLMPSALCSEHRTGLCCSKPHCGLRRHPS